MRFANEIILSKLTKWVLRICVYLSMAHIFLSMCTHSIWVKVITIIFLILLRFVCVYLSVQYLTFDVCFVFLFTKDKLHGNFIVQVFIYLTLRMIEGDESKNLKCRRMKRIKSALRSRFQSNDISSYVFFPEYNRSKGWWKRERRKESTICEMRRTLFQFGNNVTRVAFVHHYSFFHFFSRWR